jgi:hypothetical protein
MTLFAIIQESGANSDKLAASISKLYPDATYVIDSRAWVVSDTLTAKGVSDKLGISDGENGSALIFEVASYFGRSNPAIWSWMKSKWEGAPSG